jgi:4a-hydroxytetrahydrobiopterin dehydratase
MNDVIKNFAQKNCSNSKSSPLALDPAIVETALKSFPAWQLRNSEIVKTFRFANYHETMAFVNEL